MVETTISAPTGTYASDAVTTDSHGVVQASEPPTPSDASSSAESMRLSLGSLACLLCLASAPDANFVSGAIFCTIVSLVGGYLYMLGLTTSI